MKTERNGDLSVDPSRGDVAALELALKGGLA